MTTKRITNGELQTFKGCRRKWWLTWYRRQRPLHQKVTGAAPLGTRVHLCLQAHYSPLDPRNPFDVLNQSWAEDMAKIGDDWEQLAILEKEVELARIMLEGYFQWLEESGEDQGLTVVAAEEKVIAPFPAIPGIEMMGKLDLRVIRDVDGARLFLDHKTVGSINKATKMLHMSEQMMHYHLLEHLDYLQRLGENEAGLAPHTQGGLYNMLRKVRRSVRAKPPFFGREDVMNNVHKLRAYYMRVYGEVLEIMRAEQRLDAGEDPRVVAYPSPTNDCDWKCEYFGVCPIFDESPEAAEGFLRDWYEEADPLDRYAESTTEWMTEDDR